MSDRLAEHVVLLFGCPTDAIDRLGLRRERELFQYAFRGTLEVHDIRFLRDEVLWWLDPTTSDSRLYLYERLFHGSRTPKWVDGWIGSARFVKDARRRLVVAHIDPAIGLDSLPKGWEERVSLVIFDDALEVEGSLYARRVFEGWFPNATYQKYLSGTTGRLKWFGAEVTELKPRPSPVEVLDWPVSQLPSRLTAVTLNLVQGVVPEGKVIGLIQMTRAQLFSHFSANILDRLEETLEEHVLKLGMTDLEIIAWRNAVDPPQARSIAEMVGCAG